MKLLVDIDDRLFREVRRLTRAKKKKDAIIIPMKEYVLVRKRGELAAMIGKGDWDMTLLDLRSLRKKWKRF